MMILRFSQRDTPKPVDEFAQMVELKRHVVLANQIVV